jgi:YgiT-type zinc finger domain-containing protein
MRCAQCPSMDAAPDTRTRVVRIHGQDITIENDAIMACPACNSQFYTPEQEEIARARVHAERKRLEI